MDSTILNVISTQKVSAGATAATSEAAPGGVQACYVHAGSERVHIDSTGATADTSAMPIGANGSHYIKVNHGQTISYIRGGSTDGDLWFTWVKD